ncbi:hypothetical protein DX933_12975 [Ornithinibacillus gellani]|uniref:hypothetical protein n=1 Tax=Ornithinibacillus gellani TaxID=2293253 RepID=UPI000F48ECE7|nr:hypothetical protein [Ornithinibacillus gellani]TQS74235.1 hypothetical protein DX933_12975 [Ornithinibacillus gellani]
MVALPGLLIAFMPIILAITAIILVIRFVKRAEARADERLKMDQENASNQQAQLQMMNELGEKITRIERLLKDVE